MKTKNLLIITLMVLSRNFINCSDKYTIDYTVAKIKDIADVPTIQYLCRQVVRKDWDEKVDETFELAKKDQLTQIEFDKLESLLLYNQYLQNNPKVTSNITLPSIFHIKKNGKNIHDYLSNQQCTDELRVAFEDQSYDEYKSLALGNLYESVDKIFKIIKQRYYTQVDFLALQEALIDCETIHNTTQNDLNITLPSIFDLQDKDNFSIIDYIIEGDNAGTLRLMLDHGLDLYSYNKSNHTLLHAAIYRNAVKCVELTLKYKKNGATDFAQGIINEQNTLQLLKTPNNAGGTPLGSASQLGHFAIIKLLLQAGANVNQYNKNSGRTSLHWAALKNNEIILQLLLDFGADINQADHYGVTALHHAALQDNNNAIIFLLNNRARINQVDNLGNTPLFKAGESIGLFINAKADVNHRNNHGDTALHFIAIHNECEWIQLLLNAGASVNPVNKAGKTPLFYAEQEQADEAVELLRSVGGWIIEPSNAIVEVDNNQQDFKKQKIN